MYVALLLLQVIWAYRKLRDMPLLRQGSGASAGKSAGGNSSADAARDMQRWEAVADSLDMRLLRLQLNVVSTVGLTPLCLALMRPLLCDFASMAPLNVTDVTESCAAVSDRQGGQRSRLTSS